MVPRVSNPHMPTQEEQQGVHLKKKTASRINSPTLQSTSSQEGQCQLLHLFSKKFLKYCMFSMLKLLYLAIQPTPCAPPTTHASHM